MTTTFQTVGEPVFKDKSSIKDKIFYEMVHRLLRLGRRYVPIYFVRGMTDYIYSHHSDKSLVGVEIGVQNGFNSKVMLMVLPIKMLYLIDPYEDYVEDT
ncbi:unnamed protein product, partial [marine sediment metagenome]